MPLRDRLPKYLLGKYQLIMTVTFTALFSIVLMLVNAVFSDNVWFRLEAGKVFILTVIFFALALGIVILSKRLMYLTRNTIDLSYAGYIGWSLGEAILIALLYTFFTVEGESMGLIDLQGEPLETVIISAFVYCAVSLGVPYWLAGQYFALNEKNNTIRMMDMENVVGDQEPSGREEKRITLFDNSGVLKFSVNASNLYYIESDDNYIKVWYSDASGALKMYMLRCRLKTVEESFAGSDLVRCHRKYMVNMTKVQLLTSEKEGYFIDLDIDSVDRIPVSKTYEEKILSIFNSR